MIEVKNAIQRMMNSKSITNSGWIIGQQVFQMLLQLVVSIITARYLGPSNYGTLNYTASFVTFFTSIASLGMDGVIIKKLIDHPDKEGVYIGSCMGLRLVSSTLAIVTVSIVVYLLNPDEPIKVLLVFLQSCALIFSAIQILDSWFQRHLRSKYVSISKIIACLVVYSYKIFLLVTAKGLVWFAVSNILTDSIIALVELIFYKKQGGEKLKFNLGIGQDVLKESYHFIISGLMVSLYSQMDRVMIGQFLNDLDVGLYSMATTISSMWIFIPTAIINSFRPVILERKSYGDEKGFLLRLEQLYSFIIWLCIIVSFIVALGARLAIYVLYGSAYLGAVPALRISIWCETFAMIGSARGIWILAEQKNKYIKYYLSIGLVVNLLLNSLLIPYMGINGAAIATLITQITTSIIAPLFFKETRVHTRIVIESFLLKWRW